MRIEPGHSRRHAVNEDQVPVSPSSSLPFCIKRPVPAFGLHAPACLRAARIEYPRYHPCRSRQGRARRAGPNGSRARRRSAFGCEASGWGSRCTCLLESRGAASGGRAAAFCWRVCAPARRWLRGRSRARTGQLTRARGRGRRRVGQAARRNFWTRLRLLPAPAKHIARLGRPCA